MSIIQINVTTHVSLEEIARQVCKDRNQQDRFPLIHDQIIELCKLLTKEQITKVIQTLETGKYTP